MNLAFCISLSLLGFSHAAVYARSIDFVQNHQPVQVPNARQLVAAVSPSRLDTREEVFSITFNNQATFDYLHEHSDDPDLVFTATLDVESLWPILVLEDIDVMLDDISCSDSQVGLSFISSRLHEELKRAVEYLPEFVVVTSHDGCDGQGERSARRVTNVQFDDAGMVTFEATKSDWEETFHSTRVSFSRRHRDALLRRTSIVGSRQKRQAGPSTPTAENSAPSVTVNFPAPSVTTGVASTATKSLSEHYTDRQLFPPEITGADMLIPQGVTVSCKNCSLEGDIELTMGSFNLTGSDMTDIVAFADHGTVEVLSRGLFSQIELDLDLSLDEPLASLNMSLPQIPLTPFAIPGVLTFGPVIDPQITMSLDLIGEIGFSYGFNLSVPDNARIQINMGELSNSSITGFDQTTFHALPFQSTSAITSLVLTVAFNPQILLGVTAASQMMTGGIGAFLNLPKLTVNATQLTDVNERCEPVSEPSNGDDDDITSALDEVWDSLTNIIPSVEVDMGILADFSVEVDALSYSEGVALESVLASTSYPLPTACLQFNPDSKKYGPPEATPSATASEAGSSSNSKDSGGVRGRPTVDGLCVALGVLLSVVLV